MFKDKTLMITGGTGSFGNRFITIFLKKFKPRKIIVYSRDEYKQFLMSQKFPPNKYIRSDIEGAFILPVNIILNGFPSSGNFRLLEVKNSLINISMFSLLAQFIFSSSFANLTKISLFIS